MSFEMADYKEVPQRIADLKAKHPDAVLRPVDPARPFWFEEVGGKVFLVYAAACYRSPDDALPGIGCAWEPFPGKTPYTRDSELQNAETSAWGRAIVAALRSESKAVASAQDIRNRKADNEATPLGVSAPLEYDRPNLGPAAPPKQSKNTDAMLRRIFAVSNQLGLSVDDAIADALGYAKAADDLSFPECRKVNDWLTAEQERQA
jgi:hypothetical protein